jgi:hypothetical protein
MSTAGISLLNQNGFGMKQANRDIYELISIGLVQGSFSS